MAQQWNAEAMLQNAPALCGNLGLTYSTYLLCDSLFPNGLLPMRLWLRVCDLAGSGSETAGNWAGSEAPRQTS